MLCEIKIDGAALRNNFSAFQKLAQGCEIAPVLKANAYGHGISQTFQAIRELKPKWLCVNYTDEASELRALGYKERILVVGPCVARQLEIAANMACDVTIGNFTVLAEWVKMPKPPMAHLKFDTGMGRQGFLPSHMAEVRQAISGREEHIAGISTHFANVEDVTEYEYAKNQLQRFERVREAFKDLGEQLLFHAASSASMLLLANSHFNLGRVGISLYGFWPSQATRISYFQMHDEVLDLKPALSWKTEITSIKEVAKGEFIGYGCTYRTNQKMKIAVIPVGYFEGYPRIAGEHQSYVLIDSQRCPLVGRICMNMFMVDISHLESSRVGDIVTLIGKDGSEEISAEQLAQWSQTIHYELVSRLHQDITRTLV